MEKRFHLEQLYSAVRFTHLHHVRVEPGWSYVDHRHTNLEFKYCVSGSLRMWIDGLPCDLFAGDAVVVKPGLYHRSDPVVEACEFVVFHFDVESELVHAAFQTVQDPLVRSESDGGRTFIPGWIDAFLAEFGERLALFPAAAMPADSAEALFLLRLQARLLEFIGLLGAHIVRVSGESRSVQAQTSLSHIAREAAHRIKSRFPQDVRIGELAGQLGIHRSYLCDCFKKVYGMSPRAYVNLLRIREAKALLQDTPYSVEDIAERLGFSSSAHFCRFFRQTAGVSPGRFRNR